MPDNDEDVMSMTDQPIPELQSWIEENHSAANSARNARLARKRLTREQLAYSRRWVAYRTLARARRVGYDTPAPGLTAGQHPLSTDPEVP